MADKNKLKARIEAKKKTREKLTEEINILEEKLEAIEIGEVKDTLKELNMTPREAKEFLRKSLREKTNATIDAVEEG